MSFGTELQTLISIDNSLNTYCNGGIYYEIYPENISLTKTWIVYSFNKTGVIPCMTGFGATNYNLLFKVISPYSDLVETINDYLVNKFHGLTSGGIQQVLFVNDSHNVSLEEEIYMNLLVFDATF